MRERKRAAVLLMLTLGWSGFALAADAGQGERAFQQSCSNCHTAVQVKSGRRPKATVSALAAPHMGPDLAVLSRSKGAVYVRAWVKNPWAVRPATACDPRMLKRAQVEDVIAFLSSRSRPEPERHRRSPMFRRKEQ